MDYLDGPYGNGMGGVSVPTRFHMAIGALATERGPVEVGTT